MKSVMQKLRFRPSPRKGKHQEGSPESHTAATEQHREEEDDLDSPAPHSVDHMQSSSDRKSPAAHRHASPGRRLRPLHLLRRNHTSKRNTPEKAPQNSSSSRSSSSPVTPEISKKPPPSFRRKKKQDTPKSVPDAKKKHRTPPSNRRAASLRDAKASIASVTTTSTTERLTPLVREEADPLVQKALMLSEQQQQQQQQPQQQNAPPQRLSSAAKQKVVEAVRALDRAGNALFQKGQYDAAFQRYERALWLKKKALEGNKTTKPKEPQLLLRPPENEETEKPALGESAAAVATASRSDSQSDDNSVHTNSVLASVATSINNMTYLRQRSGQASTDETMASYLKSLQIKRDILGPDHLSVGKTLNNIGSVFYLKKEYEAALTAYKDAHRILKNHLGEEHLDVGTIVSNMADVNAASGNIETALEQYRQALVLRWKALGAQDPKVIRLMEQIARLETGKQPIQGDESLHDEGEEEEAAHHHQLFLEDIKTLQTELQEDMKFFDLMERQMAIDMLKDKTRIFREMRGISHDVDDEGEVSEEDDGAPEGISDYHLPTLEETLMGSNHEDEDVDEIVKDFSDNGDVVDCGRTAGQVPEEVDDENVNDEESDGETKEKETKNLPDPAPSPRRRQSALPQPPAQRLSEQERKKALSSVRDRLERLRAARAQGTVPMQHRHFMDPTASSSAKTSTIAASAASTAEPAS